MYNQLFSFIETTIRIDTIMYMNKIIAYHTPNLCAYVSYWIPLKTENTTQLEDKTRNINMHCLFLRKEYQECL